MYKRQDLAQTPKYYKSIEDGSASIRDKIRSLSELQYSNTQESISRQMQKLDLSDKREYGYLPLAAKKKDMTIIIAKENLKVKGIIDLNPWGSKK